MAALAAASPGTDECLEEDEDELEPGLDKAEAELEPESRAKVAGGSRGAVLTRRGITLRMLLRDGLLEPARGVLSINYLGKKFVGDLGADGTITWQETGQVFNSPSAWATHCKRLVNPAKKSGCGWASVRYKGQKLDQYKAAWLRKHQPNAPAAEASLASDEDELPEEEEEAAAAKEGRAPAPEPAATKRPEEKSKKQQCRSLAEQAGMDQAPPGKKPENKAQVPVRYCTLGTRDMGRNPQTLVEVMPFAAINKFQPFNVAISSNVLLLLDFHSHLTRSEVVGYLGGRWDTNTQLLTVLRAFPCRSRLGDAEVGSIVEEEICQCLLLQGLSLVGWYHSHPFSPALPSLYDIDAQMNYQLKLQGSGNGFQPCLALICGKHAAPPPAGLWPPPPLPYISPLSPPRAVLSRQPRCGVQNHALLGDAAPGGERPQAPRGMAAAVQLGGDTGGRSRCCAGWGDAAVPVLQQRPNDYSIPMEVEVTHIQDGFLTNDVLQEMVSAEQGSDPHHLLPKFPPAPTGTASNPPGAGLGPCHPSPSPFSIPAVLPWCWSHRAGG
uniref:MPN domain containing n=1 Tax=Cairina moschata TaxID=8855 RepID=A0A8C3C9C6_CAIMO